MPHGCEFMFLARDVAIKFDRVIFAPPIFTEFGRRPMFVDRDHAKESRRRICKQVPAVLFGTEKLEPLVVPVTPPFLLEDQEARIVDV